MGIEEDILDGNDTNYAIALSCFYITYIIFAIPGTLMAKQINPSRSIAAGVMIWSIAATCQAAAFNPAGLFVCRLFVGFGEAFFAQAMAFYLSLWYTKHDLAKRVGIWVSAGAIAGECLSDHLVGRADIIRGFRRFNCIRGQQYRECTGASDFRQLITQLIPFDLSELISRNNPPSLSGPSSSSSKAALPSCSPSLHSSSSRRGPRRQSTSRKTSASSV